jgi:penicillin-binding protein A
MKSNRELQRLLTGILLMMGLIGGTAAYWAVIGPDMILDRDDNPRLVEQRASIMRGDIIDRNGQLLVESVRSEDDTVSRIYYYPSLYSTLGYYSMRYGEGGTEAAYADILSGDARPRKFNDFFQENLLHLPRHGADIQLTFDLEIQNQVSALMEGYQGAVIVLSVPDGAILAMSSQPTYDPNTLDENWETLVETEGDPFFNRALQGNYQPGGITQTILMANALLNNIPLETIFEDGAKPVPITEVRLTCTSAPPQSELTLEDAYLYGCPAPFAAMASPDRLEDIKKTFDLFYSHSPIMPLDFITETQEEVELTPEFIAETEIFTIEDVLGQGDRTLTPIQLAVITASLINDGNAPQPYTLMATRLPGEDSWMVVDDEYSSIAISPTTAQQLADLMRKNVAIGNAQSAARDSLDIGGQTAIAYSGDGTHVWFTGFVTINEHEDEGIAITIVIENSIDTHLVAEIGGEILKVAINGQ